MDPLLGTCRFAASVSALKKNLYNHICWSNKGYYVRTLLLSKSGRCKLQQTCFCNINNLHKGLCNLIESLWEQPALDTSEAGERVLTLHSVRNSGLISAFYFISPVNGLPVFFLLDLSPHFLKLMLVCFSNSYACFNLRFHLPWFTCRPWGLRLGVNRLAQITSWTHQSNPTDLFLSSCSLFSASPCYCIEWLPQKCSPSTASVLMELHPTG